MNDKPARVFIGQASRHEGKYGEYFTFKFGTATIFFEPSKTTGKLNAYVKESLQQDRAAQPEKKQEPFGIPDEQIPF